MGLKVKDCTHGFRAYKRNVFLSCYEKFATDGSFNIVVLGNARKQGYRFTELPSYSVHSGKSNAQFALRYFAVTTLMSIRNVRDLLRQEKNGPKQDFAKKISGQDLI